MIILFGKLSVCMSDTAMDIETETHWVSFVTRPDCISEDMLIQSTILAGGDERVGITTPGNVSGHIPVLVKCCKWYKWSLDIPHIDCKVYTQSTAAQVVMSLWSPLDPAHRTNGVDSVLQTMHLVPLPADCVPHLDSLVPTSCGQPVSQLRVPVTGKHMVIMSWPLFLTSVRSPRVPQLNLAIL